MMQNALRILLAFSFCWLYSPAPLRAQATVTIQVKPVYGKEPLRIADKCYTTPHGDSAFIDAFRFYMTHINLGNNSKTADKLIDADDTATTRITLNVPPGDYSQLSFVLGVDSADNTNGANSGELDPAKGMYWAWNTGYIMAKIEGRSPVCKTVHHVFEFHIGGYMPPYNTARTVRLALPSPLHLQKGDAAAIILTADAATWFSDNLDLAATNSILIPGKAAAAMADKYALMFSVTEVKRPTAK